MAYPVWLPGLATPTESAVTVQVKLAELDPPVFTHTGWRRRARVKVPTAAPREPTRRAAATAPPPLVDLEEPA